MQRVDVGTPGSHSPPLCPCAFVHRRAWSTTAGTRRAGRASALELSGVPDLPGDTPCRTRLRVARFCGQSPFGNALWPAIRRALSRHLGSRPGGRSAPVQGGHAGHPPLARRNALPRHTPFPNGLSRSATFDIVKKLTVEEKPNTPARSNRGPCPSSRRTSSSTTCSVDDRRRETRSLPSRRGCKPVPCTIPPTSPAAFERNTGL